MVHLVKILPQPEQQQALNKTFIKWVEILSSHRLSNLCLPFTLRLHMAVVVVTIMITASKL